MPPARNTPTTTGKPPSQNASEDVHAAIERVTPDVLALLQDGVPRSKATITAALLDRHPRQDIRRALMRLAVTEKVLERGGKYRLPDPG
jgi:hypothetical protein